MKSLIVSICILGMVGMVTGLTLWAATTATQTANVTAKAISISKTYSEEDPLNYGTVSVGSSTSTEPAGQNKRYEFTNDGSGAEQFSIKTSDASGGTGWYGSSTSTASNQFMHNFTTTTSPYWKVVTRDPTYTTASTSVAVSGTLDFYLKIDMPSASSDYVQKTITLTVLAETAP